MKYFSSIILIIVLISVWGCEDLGGLFLEGCTDESSCNYNADATQDDDSCDDGPEENYDCDGNCIAENPADCCEEGIVPDCNGVCGGLAVEDCAGTCNGTAVLGGCDNTCGSSLDNDDCDVCGGDGSTCNISYSGFVQPKFNTYCILCHGTMGGLSLNSYNTLMQGGNSGAVVNPGDGSNSLLIQKLRGTAGDQMPKTDNCCLDVNIDPTDTSPTITDLIEIWINEGANNN